MAIHGSRLVYGVFALALSCGSAGAQPLITSPNRDLTTGTGTYGVRTMDFDLWCQQTQRYPAERCTARRPEDVKAFEDYRSSIERYELDYLRQVQKDQEMQSRINRDPSSTVSGKQDGVP